MQIKGLQVNMKKTNIMLSDWHWDCKKCRHISMRCLYDGGL